jgi:hypothetical protein
VDACTILTAAAAISITSNSSASDFDNDPHVLEIPGEDAFAKRGPRPIQTSGLEVGHRGDRRASIRPSASKGLEA